MSYPSCFTLVERREIPDQGITALKFRHDCGMEILSLECADTENLFMLGFPTQPLDSTGAAHIVEHTVLGGSAKYPVKDPFIELVKSSLATFINAMTYPDRTVYPAASCNSKDFFNLFEVYWDAVFHPNISRQGFAQEGWHYELSGKGRKSKLVRNGIVLNEMSGYYSSFDTIMERCIFKYLLPDSPLAYDSGGDPSVIPTLTYEKFVEFYHRYYAQGRCRLLLYGDIPTETKLEFVAARLAEEKKLKKCGRPAARPRQKRWTMPRTHRDYFVPECAGDERGALVLAWFIDDRRNLDLDLEMQLLDFILEGNAGAPINKALMASGLGTSVVSGGFENDCLETIFQLGLRGVKEEDYDKVEELIAQTLAEIVRDGLSPEQTRTALRQFRLDEQEIVKLHCLDVMQDVMCNWNYGRDPLLFLDRREAWHRLEKRLSEEPGYMEKVIRKRLLENPHRLRLELCPDRKLNERRKKESAAELSQMLSRMPKPEQEQIRRESQELQALLNKGNSPEALATLPRMSRREIPEQVRPLPVEDVVVAGNLPLRRGTVPTNGVSYMCLLFDFADLPEEFRPYLPLFKSMFCRLGTENSTYDQMARRMAAESAMMTIGLEAGLVYPGKPMHGLQGLGLQMTSLEEYFPAALSLLGESWEKKVFREYKRIREVLRQNWTLTTENLMHSRSDAIWRAAAGLSEMGNLQEMMHGWHSDFAWREWSKMKQKELSAAMDCLEKLMVWLRQKRPLMVSYVGGENGYRAATDFLGNFGGARVLEDDWQKRTPWSWEGQASGRRELLVMGGDVASCACVRLAPGYFDERGPALAIGANLFSCGYLWNEVRAKNGAYGVGCMYFPAFGQMVMQSSEDPRPVQTLDLFRKIPEMGIENTWTDSDIEAGIMAVARGTERPIRPGQLLGMSLGLAGITLEQQNEYRRNLLRQTPETVREAWRSYWKEFGEKANEAAIGPERLFDSSFATVKL